ncbi:MAG: IS110 family transposase, partial [Acidimicrobiales bacterium]
MERQYVAIDLHKLRSLIVREDEAGHEVGVVRIDNDPITLAAAMADAGPEPEVAIEATYGWYWAVDVLEELGAHVRLVNPSGLAWGDRRVKNDYRDCKDLLDRMRLHKLPEAWIAPPPLRELRELVRYRHKLVCLRTGLKAQVKAVLAKHGLRPPLNDLWGPGGTAYLNGLELDDGYHIRVDSLRDLVEHCNREVAMLERVIHERLCEDPGYRAVQAIDGVGRVMAAIFVAEIGDVGRFPNPQALCSWAGLTPRHRESDTKVRRGRITKQGSVLVRWAAIEAIAGGHGGPKLKADYRRIATRRGIKIARVAVARKLLTLVYYEVNANGHCLTLFPSRRRCRPHLRRGESAGGSPPATPSPSPPRP